MWFLPLCFTHWFCLELNRCLLLCCDTQRWPGCCNVCLAVMTLASPAFHHLRPPPADDKHTFQSQSFQIKCDRANVQLLGILCDLRETQLKRWPLQPTHSSVLALSSGQRGVRHTILEDVSVGRYPADHQADCSLLGDRHAGWSSTGHCRDTIENVFSTLLHFRGKGCHFYFTLSFSHLMSL